MSLLPSLLIHSLFLSSLLLFPALSAAQQGKTEWMPSVVSRAIEQTKRRQSSPRKGGGEAGRQQLRTLNRAESIDVDALNQLIKSFDKTWISPKPGGKEPAGSNFQYKKTCASIYKARHGACSQLGFGSMCFNYCYEKGEKIQYACVDASDAAYCKSSSNFDAYLAKYRKDAYKAKAYVHQMISRCYATAICNPVNGILNSTLVESTTTPSPRTPAHIRLTRPPGATRKAKTTPGTTTTTTEEPTTEKKRVVPIWQKLLRSTTVSPAKKTTTTAEEEEEETAEKTTMNPSKKSGSGGEEEDDEEETDSNAKHKKKESSEVTEVEALPDEKTTTARNTTTEEEEEEEKEKEKESEETSSTEAPTTSAPQTRVTWRSLTVATSAGPPSEEIEASRRQTGEAAFWNRFQPNRWYPSIHYFTNTGR